MSIEKELEFLKYISKLKGEQILSDSCIVFRLFERRDGFRRSEEILFEPLTVNDFSILTRRPWIIAILPQLKIANDEPLPKYTQNEVTFIPKKWQFNKNKSKLDILYEE